MQFVDTHCHIQEPDYPLPIDDVITRAHQAGVMRLICVGTDVQASRQAVDFVQHRPNMWASIGLHPHQAKDGESTINQLKALLTNGANGVTPAGTKGRYHFQGTSEAQDVLYKSTSENRSSKEIGNPFGSGQDIAKKVNPKIIAIGECGLDYFYAHSPKQDQIKALCAQIELALQYSLPLIFHVREAFDDFWPVFDSYQNVRGVLHSFTDNRQNLDKALERGLYVGINGIMTFTKNDWQLDIAKAVPLQKLLIETDAPFLTPKPFRGTVNEPAHIRTVADFLSNLKGEPLKNIATATTANALTLFNLG